MYIVHSSSGMLTFGYVTVNLTEYCRAKIGIVCGLMHVILHILPFLKDQRSAIWGAFYIYMVVHAASFCPVKLAPHCWLFSFWVLLSFGVLENGFFSIRKSLTLTLVTGCNYKNNWDINIILSVLYLYLKALWNRAKNITKHLDVNFGCHYLLWHVTQNNF